MWLSPIPSYRKSRFSGTGGLTLRPLQVCPGTMRCADDRGSGTMRDDAGTNHKFRLEMNIPISQQTKQLWIGKVEVRPLKGSTALGDAKGAFVNIVTWAQSVEEYRRNVDLVLGELRLFIVEVENPEPVSVRSEKAVFEEDIQDMIARAQDNPNAIIYGTFHTWERDTT